MNHLINILLVEDDESLNRGISFTLKKEGYRVFSATCLEEGRRIYNEENIHLIVLDVGLPDGDGFEFCKEIKKSSDVFIIFLTACIQEVDIVTGYDLGADDYIPKPFSLMVLISKVNAVLRRRITNRESQKIQCKDITYYPKTMRIYKNNEEIFLSKVEFKLFKYFMDNPQQVISKEQFFSQLWDIEGDFLDESTLPVNIRRLREKIEDDPSKPKYIKTIRGIGYTWTERCIRQ
ncbi:response regulator transcription factor [Irregularibacter muris]|uniref:Stage 0 sporulation protein A homolog n=1 Tax=Irregularibacter muris TaxID=1796619 RepID=A0AAE3HHE7_9FIRM|nr:response regulator transcription factor [Irregularibacter muris]MCR1899617.1 response regulator transcription factor [Irregularibacter muris]